MLCQCGCGQETAKNWMRGHWNKSEEARKKNSVRQIGISKSEEHKNKVSDGLRLYYTNNSPWNKPLYPIIPSLCECGCGEVVWTGKKYYGYHGAKCRTESHNKKISESKKGCVPWNKGYGDYIKGNKHPLWNKHHTEESKLKNSKSHLGKLSGSYGKTPAHTKRIYHNSPFQGIVCFRSFWEAAYARYLDSINELWYYEIDTFELLNEMTYTPDFFLPRLNKFVEIKGRCWNEESKKFQKFQEEYPFDLEVLFGQDLKKLGVIQKCHQ